MASVLPFNAWRPSADKVHLVATRSVDRYKKNELNSKLAENPFTFFHVIKPDFNNTVKFKNGSTEHLQAVKIKFEEFCKKNLFKKDVLPAYYLYEQIQHNHSYTGIIGLSSIDDYENGVIKKHENTIADRENKLKNYLEVCNFNAEPVCMSYPKNENISKIINESKKQTPEYDFTTTDTLRHKLWIINDENLVSQIQNYFSKMPAIYIADGHHRSASSALLAKQKRESNKNHTGKENYNYYMSIFFQENELQIFEFNRLVKDLNNLSSKEFLEYLKNDFIVTETQQNKPSQAFEMTMYLNKRWYKIKAKEKIIAKNDVVNSLDAAILTNYILDPILNIKDQRTDKRIQFVSGIKPIKELTSQIDSGKWQVAFVLYPATMQQVKDIANANGIMPPKTTWVEPKLRSGLTVFKID